MADWTEIEFTGAADLVEVVVLARSDERVGGFYNARGCVVEWGVMTEQVLAGRKLGRGGT